MHGQKLRSFFHRQHDNRSTSSNIPLFQLQQTSLRSRPIPASLCPDAIGNTRMAWRMVGFRQLSVSRQYFSQRTCIYRNRLHIHNDDFIFYRDVCRQFETEGETSRMANIYVPFKHCCCAFLARRVDSVKYLFLQE